MLQTVYKFQHRNKYACIHTKSSLQAIFEKTILLSRKTVVRHIKNNKHMHFTTNKLLRAHKASIYFGWDREEPVERSNTSKADILAS